MLVKYTYTISIKYYYSYNFTVETKTILYKSKLYTGNYEWVRKPNDIGN